MKANTNIRQKGIALFNAWRADWNKFIRDVFGVVLDEEQQRIVTAVQYNKRVSVVSGTARGKDFVSACCALCFLYLTPRWNKEGRMIENTKVALSAPTDRQVRNIMMPEIARLYNNAKHRGVDLCGRLTSQDIRMVNTEWFLTGFKADEHNHEAWSGFHAVHTMFVITEASGVADNIFNAIEGNLQNDSRILIVFNPNSSVGYAAQTQKSDRWQKFVLNSLHAPNVIQHKVVIPGQVDYEWVEDKIQQWCVPIAKDEVVAENDDFEFEGQWYRPEDLFRKKVLGKFPKVSENVLVPIQWLEIAHERWVAYQQSKDYKVREHGAYRVVGVDVAGMGRDESVYVERDGNYVVSIETHNSRGEADHMKIVGNIMSRRYKDERLYVSIDTIGEGAGVYARCLELDKKEFFISCKYSEGAKNSGRDLTDSSGQYHFVNMRAYLFWCVREWLNPKNNHNAMLPPDSMLDAEATEIQWFFKSDGRIIIEPKEDIKKRLGRSTDRFDALANTFYPILQSEDFSHVTKAMLGL